jgi:hypothetical protein
MPPFLWASLLRVRQSFSWGVLARPSCQSDSRGSGDFQYLGTVARSAAADTGRIPPNIDPAAIDAYLRQQPGVTNVHDLHIWGISTAENALTVHLVMPNGCPGDEFMDHIGQTLETHYSIHHSKIQIEQGTAGHVCPLAHPRQGDGLTA